MMDPAAKKLRRDIKKIGWSKIKLTQHTYRGAVQTFKTSTRSLVAIMFYTDEAFIVEDSKGIFGVQDLNHGLIEQDHIDLESTGRIKGLTLVAFIDEESGEVKFNEDKLTELDINTTQNKTDIENRLLTVNKLAETEELEV